MFLKLNVLSDSTCAIIYATSDQTNDTWKGLSTVKIWHNNFQKSLQAYSMDRIHNCDNDRYVTFHSTVQFKEFCQRFVESSYNNPECYSFLRHNCSNAAYFALKIAKIDIPLSGLNITYLSPYYGFPTPFLSPLTLFYTVQKYKIEQLKNNKSGQNIFFKLSLECSNLHEQVKTESKVKQKIIKTLLRQIHEVVEARPHHAELYLSLIKETKAILSNRKNISRFKQDFFSSLQERTSSYLEKTLNVLGLLALSIEAFNFMHHFCSTFEYNANFLLNLPQRQTEPISNILCFCLAISGVLFGYIMDKKYPTRIQETPLSKTIEQVRFTWGK